MELQLVNPRRTSTRIKRPAKPMPYDPPTKPERRKRRKRRLTTTPQKSRMSSMSPIEHNSRLSYEHIRSFTVPVSSNTRQNSLNTYSTRNHREAAAVAFDTLFRFNLSPPGNTNAIENSKYLLATPDTRHQSFASPISGPFWSVQSSPNMEFSKRAMHLQTTVKSSVTKIKHSLGAMQHVSASSTATSPISGPDMTITFEQRLEEATERDELHRETKSLQKTPLAELADVSMKMINQQICNPDIQNVREGLHSAPLIVYDRPKQFHERIQNVSMFRRRLQQHRATVLGSSTESEIDTVKDMSAPVSKANPISKSIAPKIKPQFRMRSQQSFHYSTVGKTAQKR